MWWELDADQSSLNLQKAPALWETLGRLGDAIRQTISDIIRRPGVVWDEYSTTDDPQASETVRDVLDDNMTAPEGWTLGGVAEDLQDRLGLSQSEALDVARNETASVLNVARAETYEEYADETEQDADEFVFSWIGPSDHRTTDLCEDVKAEIDSRGGAVPLSELKSLLMEKAREYPRDGTPERVDEFHPHWNCRHTFTRRVQSF